MDELGTYRKSTPAVSKDEFDLWTSSNRAAEEQMRHDPCRVKEELEHRIGILSSKRRGFLWLLSLCDRFRRAGARWRGWVKEQHCFPSIQLVEHGVQSGVTGVDAVSIGQHDEAVTAFLDAGLNLTKTEIYVWNGQ